MNNFIVIDLETANSSFSSICQIGIVKYENSVLVDEWVTYINPDDYFDDFNIGIHGITQEMVQGSPSLPEIYETLVGYLENTICISHGSFDRNSITSALNHHQLESINTTWLDSTRIARRTWEDVRYKGYNLKNLANKVGYEFKHHDALEDAKAAGTVVQEAMKITGLNIEEWLKRVNAPLDLNASKTIYEDGSPEGDFYGDILVFTGALTYPRREAAKLAAQAGFTVNPSVTKKTTILVVGDQDISKFAEGHTKSSKHEKAEKLIAKGQNIRIIAESDFLKVVNSN